MNKLSFENGVSRLNGTQIAIQEINLDYVGRLASFFVGREFKIFITDKPIPTGAWQEPHRVQRLETSGDTVAQFMTFGRVSGGLSNSSIIPKIAAALRVPVPYLNELPEVDEGSLVIWLDYDNNQPNYYLVYVE